MVNKIYPYILFLCITTIVIIYSQDGEINRDAVMYLTQSQLFMEGNFSQALDFYNWPFFSFLIFIFHKIFGLSFLHSAHFIDGLLFLVAAYYFLKIIHLVSDSKINHIYGFLILISSIPLLDDYLGMILRDHGQWAGFMMGVYYYLMWINTSSNKYNLLWQMSFIFASLFRPECFIFNILLPFVSVIFSSSKNKLLIFFQTSSILIIGAFFMAGSYVYLSTNNLYEFDFLRLNEILTRPLLFLKTFFNPLDLNSNNFYQSVLIHDYAISLKYLFLSYVALYKWVFGLGLLHVYFFIIAIKKRLIDYLYFKYLMAFFLISFMVTVINLYATYVLASRYWVMNWWIVYIFATFGFSYTWKIIHESKNKYFAFVKLILIIFLTVRILNIYIDKPNITSENQAIDWIKNNHIDLSKINTNDSRIAFKLDLNVFSLVEKNKYIPGRYNFLIMKYNHLESPEYLDNFETFMYFPDNQNPKIVLYRRLEGE